MPILDKLNSTKYTEVTFEELKELEQYPRVVAIDFSGFIKEDMELCYDVQVTNEGTTKDSAMWDVTIYPVYVKTYRGILGL